jgi:hypothetical protein
MDDADLDAAVAAGVVTPAQATALREFAAARASARTVDEIDEERFRFMRGFNDVFFSIGIVLLGAAIVHYSGAAVSAYGPTHLAVPVLIWGAGAAICWALSELLVRRMRAVLPGILLSMLFVFFVLRGTPAFNIASYFHIAPWIGKNTVLGQLQGVVLGEIPFSAFVVALAAALFYLRFRLPFALLLLAGSLVIAVMALAILFFPPPLNGPYVQPLLTLFCGLAIFAAAMAFDLSDRTRVTRRSDCAFWLHLLAAPLIVHSLITLAFYALHPGREFNDLRSFTTNLAGITAGIVLLLTVIAIVIDRRALLVSALIYLGGVIAYAIASTTGNDNGVFFATLLILGVIVLLLGIGWRPLRRWLIRPFPAILVNRLPPVVSIP